MMDAMLKHFCGGRLDNGDAMNTLDAIKDDGLRSQVAAQIDAGELVRWCGQPDVGRVARTAWWAVGFWSVAAGGLYSLGVFNWLSDETKPNERVFLTVLPIVFAMMTTWMIKDAHGAIGRARRTVYLVTNTRLMTLIVRGKRMETTSMEPAHPLATHRIGTHTLGTISVQAGSRGDALSMRFLHIASPREVERLIRATFDPPVSR